MHGQWWPVVVMPWVSGEPLHFAVERRLGDRQRLAHLADRWLDLVELLHDKEFAHGDYQHGNVLVTDRDEFQLIDLDGVWVPDMGVGPPNEFGHPNYQHPGRSDDDWGHGVDTFSALVIALSLFALADDPTLSRFMTGENLLFVSTDFERPGDTEVWNALRLSTDAEVLDLTARLLQFARAAKAPTMSVSDALEASIETATVPRAAPAPDLTTLPVPSESQPLVQQSAVPQADVHEPVALLPDVGAETPGITAAITGHPVIAGLAGGALAGLVGSIVAGGLQALMSDHTYDGALFMVAIAAMLGGMVHVASALNLTVDVALTLRRFAIGCAAGLVIGVVAAVIADALFSTTLDDDTTRYPILVAYVWALASAGLGLALGLLRSPRAGATAFAGGGLGGFVGGFLHGVTGADFDQRSLVIDGFDPMVLVGAVVIGSLVGVGVIWALRRARVGSITVHAGPGRGAVVDVYSTAVSIGGGRSDDLRLRSPDVGEQAVRLVVRAAQVDVVSDVVVLLDEIAQRQAFAMRPGQLLTVADVTLRVDTRIISPTVVETGAANGVGS